MFIKAEEKMIEGRHKKKYKTLIDIWFCIFQQVEKGMFLYSSISCAFFFTRLASRMVIIPAKMAKEPITLTTTNADVYGEEIRIIPRIIENIPPQIMERSPVLYFLILIPVTTPVIPLINATNPKNHIKKEVVNTELENGFKTIINPAIIPSPPIINPHHQFFLMFRCL